MTNNIVITNVTETVAPTPSTLQKTGALISQGGTKLAVGATALLTQLADLTAQLATAITLASLTSSGTTATATLPATTTSAGSYDTVTGEVTLTLTADIGILPGQVVTVSGATGTGSFASIDGTFTAEAGSTGGTLIYTVATSLTMTIATADVQLDNMPASGSFLTTISGATPAGYNGTFLATVASASTFTYTIPSTLTSPATGTIKYTPGNSSELVAMATTFFGMGSQQAVYVLELGPGTPAQGVTELGAFIAASPQFFYGYLVPRSWAAESTFLSFMAGYESLTAKTYFWITATTSNYTSFTDLMKCAIVAVEAPGIPVTEFSLAADFWVALNYSPSSTNKVTPFAFSYLFGVTPYPIVGNNVLLAALKASFTNWVGTGAEGGISNAVIFWGTTKDGNDFTFWYSVDWVQINGDLRIANAIINGSNNPQNPLYYNQDGINRLQAVVVNLMTDGVSFGLVLGDIVQTQLDAVAFQQALDSGKYAGKTVINAVPFIPYSLANPGDYKIGRYAGLTVAYVPARGFTQIVFNINVSNFVAL
jgi:hypothetical protein